MQFDQHRLVAGRLHHLDSADDARDGLRVPPMFDFDRPQPEQAAARSCPWLASGTLFGLNQIAQRLVPVPSRP